MKHDNNPLLQYCQKMSMSYSYKPVLILALLDNGGKVTSWNAANYFASYYAARLEKGLVAEKSNSIYSNLNCTIDQIRTNIITNPIKALTSSSELFTYNSNEDLLEIDPQIWKRLCDVDVRNINAACIDRLDRYYAKLASSADIVLFQDVDGENGYLSNHYFSEFNVFGQQFYTMSQYMTYRKALILGDESRSRQILTITDPEILDNISSILSKRDTGIWAGQQQIVAYQGLISKFLQNETIAKPLLNTGNSLIGACMPSDCIWGIGLQIHDANARNMDAWKGQNLLGFTLMQVRNSICNTRSL